MKCACRCAIISGLVLASNYNAGQELFKDHNFADNAEFFESICIYTHVY
jgi:hypothetical protein